MIFSTFSGMVDQGQTTGGSRGFPYQLPGIMDQELKRRLDRDRRLENRWKCVCVVIYFGRRIFFVYDRHIEDFFYGHHPSKFLVKPKKFLAHFACEILKFPCSLRSQTLKFSRSRLATRKFSFSLHSKPSNFLASVAQLSNLHVHFVPEPSTFRLLRNAEIFSLASLQSPKISL